MDIKKIVTIVEISTLVIYILFSKFGLNEIKVKAQEEIEKDNIGESIAEDEIPKLAINPISTQPVSRGGHRNVPDINTSFKSYMNYRTITDKTSQQYKLQHNGVAYTDKEGFRKSGDNFLVALGTYYSDVIGEELEITLDSGESFKAMLGDIKANKDTDKNNQYHKTDGSVVEFIVDSRKLLPIIKRMGNCSYSKENNFKGNVVSITKVKKEGDNAYDEMGNNEMY